MLDMDNKMFSPIKKSPLLTTVIFYIFLTSIFGYTFRYGMNPENGFGVNPDIVSYLRLAGYIAEGNFQQSITGWWGPMLTWLLAPFLYFGVDGIISAKIVVASSGLGLLFSCALLTRRFISQHEIKLFALLIAALLISCWTTNEIALTPDLLLAAFIILYLYVVTKPDVLTNKKAAVLCGIVAGSAYLAKHYALPFFLVHFPSTLLLMGYIYKAEKAVVFKKILVQIVIGITAFFIITAPWIISISLKYDQVTIGTTGRANHAIMGPNNEIKEVYGHISFHGLHKPDNDYTLNTWEDPSEMGYKSWSPFESKEFLIYQLKIIKNNLSTIFNYLLFKSPFFSFSFLIGILFLSPIAIFLNPLNNEKLFLYIWTLATLMIYASGYALTFSIGARYYYPIMIVILLIAFHFLEELKTGINKINTGITAVWKEKTLIFFLIITFTAAFTIKPGLKLFYTVRHLATVKHENVYRNVSDQLRTIDFPAPYAIKGFYRNVFIDLVVAYYLDKQYLGGVISSDVNGITEELKNANARSLIIYDNLSIVKDLKTDKRYLHIKDLEKNKIAGRDKAINIFILK